MVTTVDWYKPGKNTHLICSHCGEYLMQYERCVDLTTEELGLMFHPPCWDEFVVAVAMFNDTLIDEEQSKKEMN